MQPTTTPSQSPSKSPSKVPSISPSTQQSSAGPTASPTVSSSMSFHYLRLCLPYYTNLISASSLMIQTNPTGSPSQSPSQAPTSNPTVSKLHFCFCKGRHHHHLTNHFLIYNTQASPTRSPVVNAGGGTAEPSSSPSRSPSKMPSVSPSTVPTGSPSKEVRSLLIL